MELAANPEARAAFEELLRSTRPGCASGGRRAEVASSLDAPGEQESTREQAAGRREVGGRQHEAVAQGRGVGRMGRR